MEFSCLDPVTGDHEWIPKPAGTMCHADDPCDRFRCDGSGYCAQRTDISSSCIRSIFFTTRGVIIFSVMLLAMIIVFILGAVALADCVRRKKRGPVTRPPSPPPPSEQQAAPASGTGVGQQYDALTALTRNRGDPEDD